MLRPVMIYYIKAVLSIGRQHAINRNPVQSEPCALPQSSYEKNGY